MGAGNWAAVKASRVLLLARLASGALLTVRPAQALRLLRCGQDDAASRTVVRVFGARCRRLDRCAGGQRCRPAPGRADDPARGASWRSHGRCAGRGRRG